MASSSRRPASARPRSRRVHRAARRTVHIISEGTKTEPVYFAAYRRKYGRFIKLNHESHQGKTHPLGLVQQAIDLKRRKHGRDTYEDGDSLWVVLDREQRTDAELAPAIELAAQHEISVALSSPCIEVWFLLHLDPVPKAASMTADRVCRTFYDRAGCDKRLSDSVTTLLIENQQLAIENAKRLEQIHTANGYSRSHNPSSGIWRLIDELERLARSG